MSKVFKDKKLPEFQSAEEEAAFWETHSVADFWDELEPVNEPLEVIGRGKKRLLSVRLSEADLQALQKMATRYGLGVGTLARVWILERLRGEKAH